MKATTRAINRAIAKHKVEIVRGFGYYYLVGEGMSGAYSTSIFTPYLIDQDLEHWIADCEELVRQAKRDRGEEE